MYRRPKFLEILDRIREDMSREADYDVDLFAEMVRNGGVVSEKEPPSKSFIGKPIVLEEIAEAGER